MRACVCVSHSMGISSCIQQMRHMVNSMRTIKLIVKVKKCGHAQRVGLSIVGFVGKENGGFLVAWWARGYFMDVWHASITFSSFDYLIWYVKHVLWQVFSFSFYILKLFYNWWCCCWLPCHHNENRPKNYHRKTQIYGYLNIQI